jgi:hypothetical protein
LVSPLDWGLGHTTRCVPLIRYILQQGHVPVFAGNHWQRKYIEETFPSIETTNMDGYDVHYSKSGSGFMFALFSQMPRLLKTIKAEHESILDICSRLNIDGIISDNRYGLYHPTIPCVIMTHQVLAQSGMGDMVDSLLKHVHYRRLLRFERCWVIDVAGKPNLSGKLGHPSVLPQNATYIGMLSQIEKATTTDEHLMVLLSGPEPQRTILSDILWEQVKDYKGKLVFVEGSNLKVRTDVPPNITYHTRITKEKLQPLLQATGMVICRSGYSTLMDLAVLKKKAILVPTPGQTEQEYLGVHLHKEGVFYYAPQKGFNLQRALDGAQLFPFKKLDFGDGFETYKEVLHHWLQSIKP